VEEEQRIQENVGESIRPWCLERINSFVKMFKIRRSMLELKTLEEG
jgi:hypothetical protein